MISHEQITEEFVDAVEYELGMGCGAWDMVDPKKIIASVILCYLTRDDSPKPRIEVKELA